MHDRLGDHHDLTDTAVKLTERISSLMHKRRNLIQNRFREFEFPRIVEPDSPFRKAELPIFWGPVYKCTRCCGSLDVGGSGEHHLLKAYSHLRVEHHRLSWL